MELDQPGHVVHHRAGKLQHGQPLPGELRSDDVVVVEAHTPTGLEPTGTRLADVVEQGSEPRHEVRRSVRQAWLEVDRLLQHGKRMLVDVLVPVVLVDLHPQPRQFGQHPVGEPAVDEQAQAGHGPLGEQQLGQLVPDTLGGYDRDPVRHGRHRGHDLGSHPEAELSGEPGRPEHSQRVVGEGRLGCRRCTDDPAGEVHQAAVRVDELMGRKPDRHRVDGEVAPDQVVENRRAEGHRGLATGRVIRVGPVGRHLDVESALAGTDGAEGGADVPHRVRPVRQQSFGLLGPGRRRQVEIRPEPVEQSVADGAAHECDLVTRGRERGPELVGHRGDPQQVPHGPALSVAEGCPTGRPARGWLGHDAPGYGSAGQLPKPASDLSTTGPRGLRCTRSVGGREGRGMSFDVLGELNWLAVIVAALAYFVLGALWYAPPVMGKTWMAAGGMETPADDQRPGAGIYVVPLVGSVLSAVALGMLAEATGTDTVGEGFVLGVVVAIGFALAIAPVTATFESNKPKPMVWGAINAGYHALGLIVAALIIGAWQ